MPRELAAQRGSWPGFAAYLPDHWRVPLAQLAMTWIVLLALFSRDWFAMADQWWNSSTYNHILLIPLILAWLVWQRRVELAKLVPSGWLPALVPFASASFLWLLGSFSGLDLARQAGAVAMLAAATLAVLGPRVGLGLAFPLGYMAFLVPFGDELVGPMQMITARLTIWLVDLSGIPARIDGVFIDTPAGLFEVAEACAGVKFLVAMIAFGVLAANVCFASWRRRAIFLLVTMIVPILANGVRAWGTIFAAQYVGSERAGGFDHIVYGWFFFAAVICLVLAISWPWFDRAVDTPVIDAGAIEGSSLLRRLQKGRMTGLRAMAMLAVLVTCTQIWAAGSGSLRAAVPRQIFLPEVPGWHRVDYVPHEEWSPRAQGAEHRLLGRYADGQGREVDVFVALYSSQGEGREAGGFGEGALPMGGPWSWQSPGPTVPGARAERLLGEFRTQRLAETYYRTGDLLTGSNARLKLANMRDRLLFRAEPTMLLILSGEERPGHPASQSLDAFRAAAGPMEAWMDAIAGLR